MKFNDILSDLKKDICYTEDDYTILRFFLYAYLLTKNNAWLKVNLKLDGWWIQYKKEHKIKEREIELYK